MEGLLRMTYHAKVHGPVPDSTTTAIFKPSRQMEHAPYSAHQRASILDVMYRYEPVKIFMYNYFKS